MKQIKIQNGHRYVTPQQALEAVGFENIIDFMDEDVLQNARAAAGPNCSALALIEKYLELAESDLIVG
ncbi:hypothetical protein IZU99_04490 [Oscillospiraceae bacterium CM]|nr:hypothetical protein IZU99_04490 [Oscillospiraceae bacterium CM]